MNLLTRRFIRLTFALISVCQGIVVKSFAQTGINFTASSFEGVLQKAKANNKPVFVEIYLKGCPHCEALDPVLKEKEVGDFYNERFVSWRTEANSKESADFQKLTGVTYPEFPQFFFFDPAGKLIHASNPADKKTRSEQINEVIAHGQAALDPSLRTAGFPDRFTSGDRDLKFLIDYGKYCKAAKDQGKLAEINRALSQQLTTPEDKTSQVGFFVLQHLMNDYFNPLSSYFFSHLSTFKAKYAEKDVRDTGESILYHTIYGPKGDLFSVNEIAEMRHAMVALGVPPSQASARLLIKELDAYFRAKNTVGAVRHFDQYRAQATSMALADYSYIMKLFNEKATDKSYLPQMPIWANEGIKATQKQDEHSEVMATLLRELSEAYFRLGQKQEAQKYANQSMDIAKGAAKDLAPYLQQVEKVK